MQNGSLKIGKLMSTSSKTGSDRKWPMIDHDVKRSFTVLSFVIFFCTHPLSTIELKMLNIS